MKGKAIIEFFPAVPLDMGKPAVSAQPRDRADLAVKTFTM